jgi:tryptophan synthase alpha chain
VTGTKTFTETDVAAAIARVRAATALPVAVGFGIKTPDQAATIARLADGVVVGSAIVTKIAENLGGTPETVVKAVTDLCTSLAQATHNSVKVTA